MQGGGDKMYTFPGIWLYLEEKVREKFHHSFVIALCHRQSSVNFEQLSEACNVRLSVKTKKADELLLCMYTEMCTYITSHS